MTRMIRPDPTDLDGHTDLDMRVSPSRGEELKAEIVHSIEWSQKFIRMTLPDRLIITQKQFISLQDDMTEMFNTEDRMYVTPLNVMEVIIDRDVETVEDIEQVMEETDELKKEIKDYDDTHQPEPES